MAERPVNPRVRGWLESGHGVDALLGRGDYFIPSPAYRDHDRVLVISQFLNWAEDGHARAATRLLKQAIEKLADTGAFGEAADVLLTYALVAKDRQTHARLLQPSWMHAATQRVAHDQPKVAAQLDEAIAALAQPGRPAISSRDIPER